MTAAFLLIPGAYHGPWCFERLIPHLEEAGCPAVAADIPLAPTRAERVSFAGCVEAVERAAGALPPRLPLVAVGHSLGGQYLSAWAEAHPGRPAALCYLTAYLLGDGASGLDLPAHQGAKPRREQNSLCKWYPTDSPGQRAALARYFFSGCPPEEADRAVGRLLPQPLAPVQTPLSLTPERWGRVPRFYIQCSEDRCIPPALQRAMYTRFPCQEVLFLPSGHSPFLSHPRQLARVLLMVAQRAARVRCAHEAGRTIQNRRLQ